jgi:hypothetical protein
MHRRSQIFGAVKGKLSAIPEFAAAGKVERGRVRAIPQEMLPAITLTWADAGERSEIRPMANAAGADGYDRRLALSIIVHLRDLDPESEFDRICVEVEKAMGEAVALDGIAIEALLQATEFFVDRETGLPLGVGRLVYATHYTTLAADPEVAAL